MWKKHDEISYRVVSLIDNSLVLNMWIPLFRVKYIEKKRRKRFYQPRV